MKLLLLSILLCMLSISLFSRSQENSPAETKETRFQNPNISILGDFIGRYQDQSVTESETRNDLWGAAIREVEIGFQANLDPYASANFYIGLHHDVIAIEEAYMDLNKLPGGIVGRIGKYRARFGKLNTFHIDQLPFVDYPLVYKEFFGNEGFNPDGGLGVSWIMPFDSFYSELFVEGFTGNFGEKGHAHGESETSPLHSSIFIANSHWKNVFELGNIPSLELGFSYARRSFTESYKKKRVNIFGSDLTFKLNFNQSTRLLLAGEFLLDYTTYQDSNDTNHMGGFVFSELKFFKDLMIGGGVGLTEISESENEKRERFGKGGDIMLKNYMGWFSYSQSEFVRYRLQYEYLSLPISLRDEQSVTLQMTFILGYHTHSTNW